MLSYCLKCGKKNTKSKNVGVSKTKIKRTKLFSKCLVCNSNKSKFLKEQKVRGILSSIGIKTLLSQIPLLGPILF